MLYSSAAEKRGIDRRGAFRIYGNHFVPGIVLLNPRTAFTSIAQEHLFVNESGNRLLRKHPGIDCSVIFKRARSSWGRVVYSSLRLSYRTIEYGIWKAIVSTKEVSLLLPGIIIPTARGSSQSSLSRVL